MATFTVHQWANLAKGLAEMRRVTLGPVVILTCDPAALYKSWLNTYAPELTYVEARRYSAMAAIANALGNSTSISSIPIPLKGTDGLSEAYYGRPERLLEAGARLANPAWSFIHHCEEVRFAKRLAQDLQNGSWDAKYGNRRT
jgi:hypothetical protein